MSSTNSQTANTDNRNKIYLAVTGGFALVLLASFLTWAWQLTRPNSIPWKYLKSWLQRRNVDREAFPDVESDQNAVALETRDLSTSLNPYIQPATWCRLETDHVVIDDDAAKGPKSDRKVKWAPETENVDNPSSSKADLATRRAYEPTIPDSQATTPPSDGQTKRPVISGPIVSPNLLRRLEEQHCTISRAVPSRTSVQSYVPNQISPWRARFTPTFENLTDEERAIVEQVLASPDAQETFGNGHHGGRTAKRESEQPPVFKQHPGSRTSI